MGKSIVNFLNIILYCRVSEFYDDTVTYVHVLSLIMTESVSRKRKAVLVENIFDRLEQVKTVR